MKKQTLICTFITCMLLMAPFLMFSQHDLTLYSMSKVPQRIYLNPSFIPEQKTYFGLPFFSGIHYAIAGPFSYHNVLTKEDDDSLNFEAEKF